MPHDPSALEALFTIRRGDDWRPSFTLTGGDVSNWDSPVVQLRSGPTETSDLLASSSEEDDTSMIALDFDFVAEGSTFSMHIEDTDTATLPVGPCWLHASVEIDGDVTTVLFTAARVAERVAVRSAP